MNINNFERISQDVNGNPRYVCHFLNLNTQDEVTNTNLSISEKYAIAVKRANTIGGRKYHNKSYGGGIVFSTYSLQDLVDHINDMTGERDSIGCYLAQRLVSALTGNGIDYQKLVDIVYGELRDIEKEQQEHDWLELPSGTCYTR